MIMAVFLLPSYLCCRLTKNYWAKRRRSRQDSQQVFLSSSEWQPLFLERKCIPAKETFVTRDGQFGEQSLQQI